MRRFILLFLFLYGGIIHAQTLEDYLQIAVENNPGLKAVHKDYEASLQRIDRATTLPDPTISAGYFVSPVETRIGPQRARIGVSQMLPPRGTLGLKEEVLGHAALARYHMFLHAKSKLVYMTTLGFYDLVQIDQLARLEAENISILESYKTMTIKQFENGLGTMVDVLKIDILLKEAKTNLQLIKDRKYSQTAHFNSLLNRELEETVLLPDAIDNGTEVREVLADSLVANHHQMITLKHRWDSQVATEQLTAKELAPRIGLGLDYILIGKRSAPNSEGNGRDAILPSISLSIPLSKKKKDASISEVSLMREATEMEMEDLQNRIEVEYKSIRYELNRQEQLLELYQEQIETSLRTLNLLFTEYGNSGKEFEDVLGMQQQVLNYQKKEVLALVQFQKTRAELDYIAGKH